MDESISTNRRHLATRLRTAIIDRECAISRQNSTSSRELKLEPINNDAFNQANAKISENCQINFIENLVDIGRKLVSQPDRESKTQRLGKWVVHEKRIFRKFYKNFVSKFFSYLEYE